MKILKRFGFFSVALVAIGVVASSSANATTIFSDDFESYADTAAMQAVWGNAGLGTLDGAFGNPGQSMAHPGGADNIVTVPVQQASASTPLIYTADIYDDGTSANKRLTAGLRFSGVANLLEMGMYNSPNHYAVRVVLPGPSWVAFDDLTDDGGTSIANEPIAGWHRFQVVLDGSTATFTIDLGSTGIINGTEVVAAAWNANGVDSIRLGGPSNLSSAGGGGFFDNVSLVSIPEPTSLALAGLASICLLGRRK
ncbi:MAG: PEP-CTERM sorting domain-containing protein [Planctomycetota bacterium]